MIYDANKNHDPIGKVDIWVYHQSCAEQDGVGHDWAPYADDTPGLMHCTCRACRGPLSPVLESPTHPHFL